MLRAIRNLPVLRYALAILLAVLAVATTLQFLHVLERTLFAVMLFAVAVTSRFCGFRAGFVASILCALGAYLFLFPALPVPVPQADVMTDSIRVLIFLAASMLLSWIAASVGKQLERARAAEERFRGLLNSLEKTIVFELETRSRQPTFVSEKAGEILGIGSKSLTQQPDFLKRHADPRDRKILEDAYRAAVETGKGSIAEHRHLRPDGNTVWLQTGIAPRQDASGRVNRILCVSHDITAAKRNEENLRFLTEATSTLTASLDYQVAMEKLAQLSVPKLADICVIDVVQNDGTLFTAAIAHRDPKKTELLKMIKRQRQALSPDRCPLLQQAIAARQPRLLPRSTDEFLKLSGFDTDQIRVLRLLGVASFMVVPLVARDVTIGAITLFSDQSARLFNDSDLEFAQELAARATLSLDNARLYQEAQKAVRMREDFLAIVSHDLKNPVSVIRLNADLLSRIECPFERGRLHAVRASILKTTDSMSRMVSDLLDLNRIETGKLVLRQTPHPVASIINDVIEMFRPLAMERELSLQHEVATDVWINCDPQRLLQVFSNLVGNAVKFTPAAGQITIRCEKKGHEVLFAVTDTGPGIPEENLARIFERYWQQKRHRREGTGLGLSIAKGIIEAHHGRIWVTSKVGLGSTFFFTIPAFEAARTAA